MAISSTRIDLNWKDESVSETGFRVQRSLGGTLWSQAATLSANTQSHQDSGLTCNTEYRYRVQSYRTSDDTESGFSNVAIATTQACPNPVEFSLQVSISGNGSVSGSGIDCPADCSQAHGVNTQVSLLALPDTGYQFNSWNGDCVGQGATCTLVMSSDRSATAFFSEIQTCPTTLTLGNTTWSSNKVFVASNTISAGPDFTVESGGVVTFQAGTEIRLKPGFTARSGSEFRAEIVSNPC